MSAFTGKTVLVLGGSRSIGVAIVRHFVTDGTSIRFTYAGSKDATKCLAQETGTTAVFTGSTGRDAVIDVVRKSGALDILAANAGIGVFGEVLELDAGDIDRLFKINIHVPYHASAEAARQMPEGERILIIGSVNGDRMLAAGMIVYTASKPVLQSMARGLARDSEPRGIAISVIQPGPIDTNASPANGPMYDVLHSLMTIKRHGRPEEVAGMVAWSAGSEAGFVIGATHTIDDTFGAQPTTLNQTQPLPMMSGFCLLAPFARSGSR